MCPGLAAARTRCLFASALRRGPRNECDRLTGIWRQHRLSALSVLVDGMVATWPLVTALCVSLALSNATKLSEELCTGSENGRSGLEFRTGSSTRTSNR